MTDYIDGTVTADMGCAELSVSDGRSEVHILWPQAVRLARWIMEQEGSWLEP